MTDCTGSVGTGCVFGGSYLTWPAGFTGWCEICEAGKTNKYDGTCVVPTGTAPTNCGLKSVDSTGAHLCLGCDNAATTYNKIAAAGCTTETSAPADLTTGLALGPLSVCHPNAKFTASTGTDFKCGVTTAATAHA